MTLAIQEHQLEQSAEALKSEQITHAGLEKENLQVRTDWHNREATVVSLKDQLEETQAELRFVQGRREEALAASNRLAAENQQMHVGVQQPPPASDNLTTTPDAPNQSTDCSRCVGVSAELAELTVLYDEVENDAKVYKERFL